MENERCLICYESGQDNCRFCKFGNPCYGCLDYDTLNDLCISNGGCGRVLQFEEE